MYDDFGKTSIVQINKAMRMIKLNKLLNCLSFFKTQMSGQ